MSVRASTESALRLAAVLVAISGLLGCGGSPTAPGPTSAACNGTFDIRPPLSGSGSGAGLAGMTIYTFRGAGTCTSYNWDFGDGEQAAGASFMTQHVFSSPGQFPVTLTSAGSAGKASSTQQVVVKSISGTWRGTIDTTPPTPFTLVLEQSGTSATATYRDDRYGTGWFSHALIGDARNGDATNWQMPWVSVNFSVNTSGGGTRQFYLNAQATADLDTFQGYCIYYDLNLQVGMRMTRQ